MAILKGFPPSNTISTDKASWRICYLCEEKFLASFPSRLRLSDTYDDCNDSVMVCEKCYHERGKDGIYIFGDDKVLWFQTAKIDYVDKEDLLNKLKTMHDKVKQVRAIYVISEKFEKLIYPGKYDWIYHHCNIHLKHKNGRKHYDCDFVVYGNNGRVFVNAAEKVNKIRKTGIAKAREILKRQGY